jgi:unsaturated rhamnogalacturonyl hydrolase
VLNRNGALPDRARQTALDLLTGSIKEEGTIPYRPDLPRVRFVDTIGMTIPLLVALGREDLALRQVGEYDRALMAGSPIPAHAFDLERGVPLGLYDWGRGVGWYALGLVGANKGGLFDDRVKALAAEMLRWQRPDGGFGARLFNDASPFESSATALMGLLMAEAHRITGEKRFLLSARAAERRLMQATRRTGEIDWCQGDTPGPGQYSRRMGIMPFAQGMALALSKELNGHEER